MKVNRIWWFGLVLSAMILVIGIINKSAVGNKDLDWTETYQVERKIPYGMYLLFRQLKNCYQEVILSDGIPEADDFGDVYLYINRYFQPDSLSTQRLLKFIRDGGQAMIAAEYIGTQLMDTLLGRRNQELRFYFDIQMDTTVYVGSAVPIKYWDEGQIAPRGFVSFRSTAELKVVDQNQDGAPIFVKFNFGQGQVWIHTIPLAFSNVLLLEERVFDYVEGVFQFLDSGILTWDIKNKSGGLAGENHKVGEKSIVGNQPLRFILRQRGLATAFYLGVFTAILYLVFGSRSTRNS